MASVEELLRGIHQAAFNGQHLENREKDIGLRREEAIPITDKQVMDGFSVKILGTILQIVYQSEMCVKDMHNTKWEDEVHGIMKSIVKFLKAEYKALVGETLSLKELSGVKTNVNSLSGTRTWLTAIQTFDIKSYPKEDSKGKTAEEKLEGAIKDWIALGDK